MPELNMVKTTVLNSIKEYLYNTELLKHYYQPSKQVAKEKEKEALTPKTGPLPPAN
jgi:hypothetical protein